MVKGFFCSHQSNLKVKNLWIGLLKWMVIFHLSIKKSRLQWKPANYWEVKNMLEETVRPRWPNKFVKDCRETQRTFRMLSNISWNHLSMSQKGSVSFLYLTHKKTVIAICCCRCCKMDTYILVTKMIIWYIKISIHSICFCPDTVFNLG